MGVTRIKDYGGHNNWVRHYTLAGTKFLEIDMRGPGPGGGAASATYPGGGGGQSGGFRIRLRWANGAPSGFYFDVLTQLGAGPGFLANQGIVKFPKQFCESPDPVNDPNGVPLDDFLMIAGSGMPGGNATLARPGYGDQGGNVASNTPDQDPNGPGANTPGYRARWPKADERSQWNHVADSGKDGKPTGEPGKGGAKGDNGWGGDGAPVGGTALGGGNGYCAVMEMD